MQIPGSKSRKKPLLKQSSEAIRGTLSCPTMIAEPNKKKDFLLLPRALPTERLSQLSQRKSHHISNSQFLN